MTPPELLLDTKPADFVGEYVTQEDGGEAEPLVDVYEGELAESAVLEAGDRVYEFMPVAGDELDAIGQPYAVAAVEGVRQLRNGQVAGWLSFAVGGPETSSHTSSPNPVIEGRGRFTGLLHELTKGDHVDSLFMRAENTNLTPDELRVLGFKAVTEGDTVFKLELPADKKPDVATAAAA